MDITFHNMCRMAYETPKNLIWYFKLRYSLFNHVIWDFRVNADELDTTLNIMGSIAYETPKNLIWYFKLMNCPFYNVF